VLVLAFLRLGFWDWATGIVLCFVFILRAWRGITFGSVFYFFLPLLLLPSSLQVRDGLRGRMYDYGCSTSLSTGVVSFFFFLPAPFLIPFYYLLYFHVVFFGLSGYGFYVYGIPMCSTGITKTKLLWDTAGNRVALYA
jgi:hypothetical protein